MVMRSPVILLESMPPKVSSPFVTGSADPVGWNDIPIMSASMKPWENALSMTVGIVAVAAGKRVSRQNIKYIFVYFLKLCKAY